MCRTWKGGSRRVRDSGRLPQTGLFATIRRQLCYILSHRQNIGNTSLFSLEGVCTLAGVSLGITPTWRGSADPVTPCPPTGGWPPSGNCWGWMVMGPATSIDTDSDPSASSTFRSTGDEVNAGVVAATEAESPGCVSSLLALALVK